MPPPPPKTAWWRRALGAFQRRPTVNVAWSDDAGLVVDAASSGSLMAALADSMELAPFYRAASVDLAKLHLVISDDRHLDRVAFVARATAAGAGKAEAKSGDLLYALLRLDENCAAACAKLGVTRARLTTFLAHGVVEHDAPSVAKAPRGIELEVMLHNDDYTPQDFVVKVLREVFALDHVDATKRMLEVHHAGGSVVATLPRTEAVAAANKALDAAKKHGFPLLVTVESFDS